MPINKGISSAVPKIEEPHKAARKKLDNYSRKLLHSFHETYLVPLIVILIKKVISP